MSITRLPTLFVPHGGGPWPAMTGEWGSDGIWNPLYRYLKNLLPTLTQRPRTLLVVTAHWEEELPTLTHWKAPP